MASSVVVAWEGYEGSWTVDADLPYNKHIITKWDIVIGDTNSNVSIVVTIVVGMLKKLTI